MVAADCSSAASRFHAADAARKGVEPDPEYILAELTSGGKAPKSMVIAPTMYTGTSDRRLPLMNAFGYQKKTSHFSFQNETIHSDPLWQ
jgi:hypothetical protein